MSVKAFLFSTGLDKTGRGSVHICFRIVESCFTSQFIIHNSHYNKIKYGRTLCTIQVEPRTHQELTSERTKTSLIAKLMNATSLNDVTACERATV